MEGRNWSYFRKLKSHLEDRWKLGWWEKKQVSHGVSQWRSIITCWATTALAADSIYIDHHVPVMHHLEPVSVADIIVVITLLPSNQCSSDSLPTWLLKKCIETLSPVITTLANESISTGTVPASWKHSIVIPHLKKIWLDENFQSNFRPVFNLPFLSKVLEWVILHQLVAHLSSNGLLPEFQSAYRKGHSTVSAIIKVFSDIFDDMGKGKFVLL